MNWYGPNFLGSSHIFGGQIHVEDYDLGRRWPALLIFATKNSIASRILEGPILLRVAGPLRICAAH